MSDDTLDGSGTAPRSKDRWQHLSLVVMIAGIGSLAAAAVLFVLMLNGSVGGGHQGPGVSVAFSITLPPQPTATATPPPPSEAPIAHLDIPRFEIDAPVQVRGVDANRVMEAPDGPKNVAWYDFSAKPGFGSNAVFSGHVDYIGVGAAVFWHLKDLNPGDLVEVKLDDGTVYQYAVTDRHMVAANPTQDVLQSIVGPTKQDVVTLITCGGSWDGREYDQRVIVRAERVIQPVTAAAGAPQSP